MDVDRDFVGRIQQLVDIDAHGNLSELARRIGVRLATIQNWLAGGEPTRPMLLRIVGGLGVRLEWLAEGRGPKYEKHAAFANRVRFVIERLGDIAAAAEAAELSKRKIEAWVSGAAGAVDGSTPVSHIRRLAEATQLDERWLIAGRGQAPAGYSDLPASPTNVVAHWGSAQGPGDEFVTVPFLDVAAAAGAGSIVESERVKSVVAFRADWVRDTLGVAPTHLVVITATGDSMEPGIEHGDAVLVEIGVDRLRERAIYAIERGGETLIKRPQQLPGGRLVLHSDNPAWRPEEYAPDEAADVHILGRVRWVGRTID